MKPTGIKSAIAIVLILTAGCESTQQKVPVIRSNTEKIEVFINFGESHHWTVVPEEEPDRLEVECKEEVNRVVFTTDVDSIAFDIKEKDTVQFYVLLNDKDSALTEVVGGPKNANFTDEYIKLNRGKFNVEVPEVHELANILVAISKVGQLDSNMVDMTTPYHKEVLNYFLPFKNHPMVDTINRHITAPYKEDSYWYYYALKMNACGYVFNQHQEIVDDGVIRRMGFSSLGNPVEANLSLLQDFSEKSNFRDFYEGHRSYYDTLISVYKSLNPIGKMQAWLESKFPIKYGNYRVTFSPLVGGAHATQKYADNGFEQTVMFICRAEYIDDYSKNMNELLESRVVFTEIDHNFVNPISAKYLSAIDTAFSERSKWVDEAIGSSMYATPSAVFNEYMTWAVFTLYANDNFPEQDVLQFMTKMEKQMENSRGYVRFKEFNRELLRLYKENPDKTVDELYPAILAWSSQLS